jgi:glycosyltransferase involved in cell wall biosynthesis
VAAPRIAVVEPGTEPAALARGYRTGSSRRDGPLHLLCVASITPRKDHETLIAALAMLRDRHWLLRCAGAFDRDMPAVRRLRAQIDACDLADRIALLGDLAERDVAAEYDHAHVFVLPTRFEGYGMAVAEALARGLPVISTPTGAIADLVTGHAGILFPPGDAAALAAALARVMDDDGLRERLASGARQVRSRLPTWEDAVAKMDAILTDIGRGV